jgi:molybdopterin-biosynthesis enzyme MoeA-like protein
LHSLLSHSDEILNGKTRDTNSNYFAKFCFENGIDLKRIEVIPDDEDDMWVSYFAADGYSSANPAFSIEASRRLVEKYDFVITSGGIGPTHDGPLVVHAN